jgi:Arc/MetJ-type ribon-helix-helix transcriptional regulator
MSPARTVARDGHRCNLEGEAPRRACPAALSSRSPARGRPGWALSVAVISAREPGHRRVLGSPSGRGLLERNGFAARPDAFRDGIATAHPGIPTWYHSGMSKQIAVRLSDGLVEFVDEIVESGRERSRAAVVARALERERRRLAAEGDAEILAAAGPDPELAGLAEYAAGIGVEN